MSLTRRSILGGGIAGLAAGLLPIPGLRNLAFAGTGPEKPLLIVVHLRGGCDGLNLISPATDPDFIEARASELRVAADGPDAGHALANGPDPKIDFRLHAQAHGMAELYQSGQLAFLHAVGLTDGTRSHFVATDMIERGVADAASLNRLTDGWLTRALAVDGRPTGLVAASASGSVSGELIGLPSAIAVPTLDGGMAPPGGAQAGEVLKRLYAFTGGDVGLAGRDALGAMATIDGHLGRDAQGHIPPYQTEPGVDYAPAAEFGRPLKALAQLIKMEIGLEAATVDIGGWDMHEYQPGRFKTAVDHLSVGLASFWNDMARYHDRMVLVTLTEFGRRLRSNKSQGTDHGRASVMTVLGGKIHGGRFYGPWPGMAPDKLDEGVDLAVATDYRRVLTELLEAREGRRLPTLFPNYAYPGPLGLFGGPPTKA